MDGAVDNVASVVDAQAGRVIDEGAVDVDLDQIGRGDLVEQQAKRVDQEVLIRPRHPRGKVRVDVVGPAFQGGDPVSRRQFHPHLPLFRADPIAHVAGVDGGADAGLNGQRTDVAHA